MIRTILISMSGGRTSAYMTFWLLKVRFKAVWNEDLRCHIGIDEDGTIVHLIVVFANTSKEEEETLIFIRNCDEIFGFNTIWVQAIVYPKLGKGNGAEIVSFETAKRKGEIFKEVIKKHGIPNMASMHCTRELKAVPIRALMRNMGYSPKDYETAIGYRIDEPKRWKSPKQRIAAKRKKHTYFFVDEKPVTKIQVNGWWEVQQFNLMLEEFEGNCTLCYKKSEPKLLAFICKLIFLNREDLFWGEMEKEFKEFIPIGKRHNPKIKLPIYFYRGHTSYEKLREKAIVLLENVKTDTDLEVLLASLIKNFNSKNENSCSESCEPF